MKGPLTEEDPFTARPIGRLIGGVLYRPWPPPVDILPATAGGWGSADVGSAWTTTRGTGADFTIGGPAPAGWTGLDDEEAAIKVSPRPGDGDPMEYGGRLPDGRRWVHPPWGPVEIDDRPEGAPWIQANTLPTSGSSIEPESLTLTVRRRPWWLRWWNR